MRTPALSKKTTTELPSISNQFINDWLEYTGGSESPDLFNLWTGISTIAACLGRRNSVQIGRFTSYPNHYIIIIGPAAVRKSSAGMIAKKLLKKYTDVKFGPHDTGGKRQGLISAFIDAYKVDDEADEKEAKVNDIVAALSLPEGETATVPTDAFSTWAKNTIEKEKKSKFIDEPHDLYIFANELGNMIGVNQIELINALTNLYDNEDDFAYRLANVKKLIYKPGLNILACTTPTSLVSHMPPTAIGEGFSSRCIMVYSGRAKEKIFPVPELNKTLETKIGEVLTSTSLFNEKFTVTPRALEAQEKIYKQYKVDIDDTRFSYYEQRRGEHLTKLYLCLCAARQSTKVTLEDVLDAHLILQATEVNMSSALGELGMDKATIAKQQMLENIVSSWPHGLSKTMLQSNMMRDLRSKQEFIDTLNNFITKGICTVTTQRNAEGQEYEVIIPAVPDKLKKKPTKKQTREYLLASLQLGQ